MKTFILTITMMSALGLAGCQSTNTPSTRDFTHSDRNRAVVVYSGWFSWGADSLDQQAVYQCMTMVLNKTEELSDGSIRYEGTTQYVYGNSEQVDYVDADMLLEHRTSRFTIWESNPTSDNFTVEGRFEGQATENFQFLDGAWIWEEDGSREGTLSLRRGADAPCRPSQPL